MGRDFLIDPFPNHILHQPPFQDEPRAKAPVQFLGHVNAHFHPSGSRDAGPPSSFGPPCDPHAAPPAGYPNKSIEGYIRSHTQLLLVGFSPHDGGQCGPCAGRSLSAAATSCRRRSMCWCRRITCTMITSGSSPFSARHSIIEQKSAWGSRVAQSRASSTVSVPERSAPLTWAQILSNSTPFLPSSDAARAGGSQPPPVACRCPLQILPSVTSRPQPTGRTGGVNSANRRGTGGQQAGGCGRLG